ncbi:MAG: hypothetical protein QOE17_159, partial [Gaiellales bacterium]|nr:hypothetical protein [Gaiellales bacterium]
PLAVADRAAAHCRRLAADRGIELTVSGSAARVAVDVDLGERILQPLIENACRFARTLANVQIARNGASVTFAVTDDGDGVSDLQRSSIFERGVRGDRVDGDSGAGLGLALARRLARSAGGDITAEPGRGGHFVVTLPSV